MTTLFDCTNIRQKVCQFVLRSLGIDKALDKIPSFLFFLRLMMPCDTHKLWIALLQVQRRDSRLQYGLDIRFLACQLTTHKCIDENNEQGRFHQAGEISSQLLFEVIPSRCHLLLVLQKFLSFLVDILLADDLLFDGQLTVMLKQTMYFSNKIFFITLFTLKF